MAGNKYPDAYITPGMLQWARTTAGYDLDHAAKKLGISPEKLAEWEAGESRPSIAKLHAIGKQFHRNPAIFYFKEPPESEAPSQTPTDFRTLSGADASVSPTARIQFRELLERREEALALARELDESSVPNIGNASLKDSIERIAVAERKRLGVSIDAQLGWSTMGVAFREWRKAVEASNILVFAVSDVALDEIRGVSWSFPEFPVIGINSRDLPQARSFTLFHEYGHLLLRQSGVCDLQQTRERRRDNNRIEYFCNAFAAALLLPIDAVQLFGPNAAPVTIAKKMNVSEEVALRRLLSLERISAEYFDKELEKIRKRYREELGRAGGRSDWTSRYLNRSG